MHDLFSQPDDADAVALPGVHATVGRYVRVAVERGIEAPGSAQADDGFTYALPPDRDLQVGARVRVPLGRGNKPTRGIVLAVGGPELLNGLSPAKVKPILPPERRESDVQPVLSGSLLRLADWMAGYYVCPLGMVLATMTPAAVKHRTGVRAVELFALADTTPSRELTKPEARALDRLRALPPNTWPAPAAGIAHATATETTARPGPADGVQADSPSPRAVSVAMIKRLAAAGALSRSTSTSIRAAALPGQEPHGQQPNHQHPDAADDPDAAVPPAFSDPAVDSRDTDPACSLATVIRPELTPDQAAAVAGIGAQLDRFGVHLLLGVTGSGKTEVYLRLIEALLARPPHVAALCSPAAIILVPEIALTPQTSARFLGRFGAGRVAVLHSALSASQRHAQWAAAAAGRVDVVVGARSAVFAPLPRVGLIIVDEEHDSSYKQDQLPRYHARDLAIKRAQLEGCPIVLGSATPSLESYANAVPGEWNPAGPRYLLWRLPNRVGAGGMPTVRVVDLAQERRDAASRPGGGRFLDLVGPTLEHELRRTLASGKQAMLLLNRRGYANHICCPDQRCGWVMHCNDCDVTLVYHLSQLAAGSPSGAPLTDKRHGYVRCHHCLAEHTLPNACPVCAKRLNTFGHGTQRVEEELERKFAVDGLVPGDTLLRVDRDTMQTARDYFDALGRFARGDARVLLGTQMIAKGLDFPGVALVGVLNADTALHLPDFRAVERTYQLVSQVAGRAGRAAERGLVIVQTMDPQSEPIRLAAAHDFERFAQGELRVRARANLPPTTRMARVVCRDPDHTAATAHAAQVHAALAAAIAHQSADHGATAPWSRLRPPAPCPISRIAGQHRVGIELLASSRGFIQRVLAAVRAQGLLKSDTRTAVDVDPIALL